MPSKRDAEDALRRAGMSRADAKRVIAHGLDGELEEADPEAASLIAALRGETPVARDYGRGGGHEWGL